MSIQEIAAAPHYQTSYGSSYGYNQRHFRSKARFCNRHYQHYRPPAEMLRRKAVAASGYSHLGRTNTQTSDVQDKLQIQLGFFSRPDTNYQYRTELPTYTPAQRQRFTSSVPKARTTSLIPPAPKDPGFNTKKNYYASDYITHFGQQPETKSASESFSSTTTNNNSLSSTSTQPVNRRTLNVSDLRYMDGKFGTKMEPTWKDMEDLVKQPGASFRDRTHRNGYSLDMREHINYYTRKPQFQTFYRGRRKPTPHPHMKSNTFNGFDSKYPNPLQWN